MIVAVNEKSGPCWANTSCEHRSVPLCSSEAWTAHHVSALEPKQVHAVHILPLLNDSNVMSKKDTIHASSSVLNSIQFSKFERGFVLLDPVRSVHELPTYLRIVFESGGVSLVAREKELSFTWFFKCLGWKWVLQVSVPLDAKVLGYSIPVLPIPFISSVLISIPSAQQRSISVFRRSPMYNNYTQRQGDRLKLPLSAAFSSFQQLSAGFTCTAGRWKSRFQWRIGAFPWLILISEFFWWAHSGRWHQMTSDDIRWHQMTTCPGHRMRMLLWCHMDVIWMSYDGFWMFLVLPLHMGHSSRPADSGRQQEVISSRISEQKVQEGTCQDRSATSRYQQIPAVESGKQPIRTVVLCELMCDICWACGDFAQPSHGSSTRFGWCRCEGFMRW